MVVYETYRVPVEVELEIETGEIMDVHIVDEKLEGRLGVFDYELQPIKGRLKKRALELVEVAEWPGWTFRLLTRATTGRDRLGPGLVLLRSFLQTKRAKLGTPRRTQKASSEALQPNRRSPRNPCYTLKRISSTSPSSTT